MCFFHTENLLIRFKEHRMPRHGYMLSENSIFAFKFSWLRSFQNLNSACQMFSNDLSWQWWWSIVETASWFGWDGSRTFHTSEKIIWHWSKGQLYSFSRLLWKARNISTPISGRFLQYLSEVHWLHFIPFLGSENNNVNR